MRELARADAVRPENVVLDAEQRRRVSEQISSRAITCRGCGGGSFAVGNALPLGFLFLDEQHGCYMVALTCAEPGCPAPHTGVKLSATEFLLPGRGQPGRTPTIIGWGLALGLGALSAVARHRARRRTLGR